MRVPGKNVMLGGLMGLWATVAAVQVSSLPELSEVPLTYTSGQPVAKAATSHVAKDALELRPMRIVAAHLPSTPKRNIFEAAETPTSEKRLVRAAVNKKEVPPPIPRWSRCRWFHPRHRCPLRKKWPNRPRDWRGSAPGSNCVK
jgi:hypothetical protein